MPPPPLKWQPLQLNHWKYRCPLAIWVALPSYSAARGSGGGGGPAGPGRRSLTATNPGPFSGLDEIKSDNVGAMKVAFTFSTGINKGHEAAPLVVGSTMYIVTPYPNDLYALDLTKPGAPVKWKFSPKPAAASQGVACCG